MTAVRILTSSDSSALSVALADALSYEPILAHVFGGRDGILQRRLVFRNVVITTGSNQRIAASEGFGAVAQVVDPGARKENLHQFILRGTMKIPFVIDSALIARLASYEEFAIGAAEEHAGKDAAHLAVAAAKPGSEDALSEAIGLAADGWGCYFESHCDRDTALMERMGFEKVFEGKVPGTDIGHVILVLDS